MKRILFLLMVCQPLLTFCQQMISGKVVSEKGEPLQGASVFITNTTIGDNTDAKGAFVLNKVPGGNVEIVVSFIGYEVTSVVIPAAARNKRYIIRLRLQSIDLSTIMLGNYDKRGWKKWGNTFITAFIGTSSYAKHCDITNKDVIQFIYNKKTNQLHAYAGEPLLIENKSLGYNIAVTMINFTYDISTKNVDYQVYSLFTEIQGTEDQELEWKQNRAGAYLLSLTHFLRALYAQNLKNEGFQVRVIEKNVNPEKQRVQALFKESFLKIKDSSGDEEMKDNAINKLIEKSIDKDSLMYYHRVLAQDDRTGNLHLELLTFKDIASHTDSATVLLRFNDYLQVTYIKTKEPPEYTAYKNKLYPGSYSADNASQRIYPSTELTLMYDIPLEINENGYFNNIDLYMQGFWGWWERIATRLPNGYEP